MKPALLETGKTKKEKIVSHRLEPTKKTIFITYLEIHKFSMSSVSCMWYLWIHLQGESHHDTFQLKRDLLLQVDTKDSILMMIDKMKSTVKNKFLKMRWLIVCDWSNIIQWKDKIYSSTHQPIILLYISIISTYSNSPAWTAS